MTQNVGAEVIAQFLYEHDALYPKWDEARAKEDPRLESYFFWADRLTKQLEDAGFRILRDSL